jgi:hypothetical protein
MASLDRIEQAKADFGDIYGQVTWLAERLSEARILVNNDQCAKCQRMSFESCKLCWCQEAAKAVREGRHSR